MKRRSLRQRRSVLVVVEGATELAFCLYLKSAAGRGRGIHVWVKNAQGGSPDRIVTHAARLARQAAYDQVAIVLDGDRPMKPASLKQVRRLRAKLVLLTPCIEGFFLQLMGFPTPADTAACKREFHTHGLGEKDKLEHDAYREIFPIEKLELMNANEQFALLWRLFTNYDAAA